MYPEYVRNWRRDMKEAYDLASSHAKKSALLGKQQYDKKVKHDTALCEGDRVLVRNMTECGGPGKLRPYWEQEIYVLTQKRKDMPVYEVKPETGIGRSRILHRNMLLPCSYLPAETQLTPSKNRQAVSKRANNQEASREETSIATYEDISSLTPCQLQELYASKHCQAEHIAPDSRDTGTGTEEEPCQGNEQDSPEKVGNLEQRANVTDDEAADNLPSRQSLRLSRPPLRMTYDAIGQPSFQPRFTTAIQGITVSYPQQLGQHLPVPWLMYPVLQPYSYFVPLLVPVQPMYSMSG